MNSYLCSKYYIFAPIFSIWITCYPPMRTINFGKYQRLFQIDPIKTVEIRFVQIGKKESKNATYCRKFRYYWFLANNRSSPGIKRNLPFQIKKKYKLSQSWDEKSRNYYFGKTILIHFWLSCRHFWETPRRWKFLQDSAIKKNVF